MYIFSVLVGLFVFSKVSSRSLQEPASIKSLNYDFDNIVDGSYSFNYASDDGSSRQEFGHVLLPGTEDEHMKVNGSYSYLGPDGVFYEVRYTADDQGFHPEGDHINVPPFVPWIHRHGQHPEEGSPSVVYSENRDIINTIGTTPTPTTQYLPTYFPGESIHNILSTTPKPSTQYLPLASNSPNYITGESIINAYKPRLNTQYLPTSSAPISYSTTPRSAFSSSTVTPAPEIILLSTPTPQQEDK